MKANSSAIPPKRKTPRKKPAKPGKLAIRKPAPSATPQGDLFDRVVAILDQARAGVVRAVNSHMVLAYWLIGREIVQDIQGGKGRAGYGQQVVEELSAKLSLRYGRGFSVTNLRYFRLFYQAYSNRQAFVRVQSDATSHASAIHHKPCDESENTPILHKPCGESGDEPARREPPGQSSITPIQHKRSAVLDDMAVAVGPDNSGFSPQLSWSHYRTLLGVENRSERRFYEIEAEKENWSVPHLERQMHTFLFARLLKSRNKEGVMDLAAQGQELLRPVDAIKHPYVLDFLDLPPHRRRTPPRDRARTPPHRGPRGICRREIKVKKMP